MKVNIFGSTGYIGKKSLEIIINYFPDLKINLLCANRNINILEKQIKIYKPKYVYLFDEKKLKDLKKIITKNTKILNKKDLFIYLNNTKSDFTVLAVSGHKSLNYFESIIKNTKFLGLVSKECIVSAGHIFTKFKKNNNIKIFPLDSEHFSMNQLFDFSKKYFHLNKIYLTASGGPFLNQNHNDLKNVTFNQAINHPKWSMGYKNSLDSATLVNKCLELIEAHYLFDIPFNKLDILIHPQALVHSIFEFKNYVTNMVYFYHDMSIPLFNFFNQKFNYVPKKINNYNFKKNNLLKFSPIKKRHYPIYDFFNNLDKNDPKNIIKFNIANEFAVNLFKNKKIIYTDIFKIIKKFTFLNLYSSVNTINEVIDYHNEFEQKLNSVYAYKK